MRINTNVSSLNAWRNLTATDGAMGKNLERLSSGYRINRAGDDVAGLAISENMRAQIKGLNQAIKNAQDGISMLQTAEGSLTEVHNMLHRMRELAVQSANGTLQPEDRKQIQTEMDNLAKEVTRITNATQFNGMDLIDGSLQSSGIRDITLQIGPNGGQTVTFDIGAMDAKSLGISRDVLTGIVDNGIAAAPAVAGSVTQGATTVATVDTVTAAVTNGTYILRFDDAGNGVDGVDDFVELIGTDGSTSLGTALWVDDGTATIGGVSFTMASAAPATGVMNTFTVSGQTPAGLAPSPAYVTDSVVEVGAGLAAGNYRVDYDAGTGVVRLQEFNTTTSSWESFGAEAAFSAGAEVVIGDTNTARTVKIKLDGGAPGASAQDMLRIGSSVGEVKTDVDSLLDGTAANGVLSVGVGLDSADYTVHYDQSDNSLQLFKNGVAIGNAETNNINGVAFAAGDVVELGDKDTGRTVRLTLGLALPAADSDATITVTNNGQAAEAARFNGGVKLESSQAFAGLNVSSVQGAEEALAKIDEAIGKVSYQRSQLGAITNRLDHTISNLNVVSENLTASESRIRDVDMALEMTQFTKQQILMQSGTAMLAQANQKNQAILSLLR